MASYFGNLALRPEENMWKPLVAATTVLPITGSSIAYAQQDFGGSGDPRFEWHHGPSVPKATVTSGGPYRSVPDRRALRRCQPALCW
jgi:hypothetical protein